MAEWALKENKNLREDELDALFKKAQKDGLRSYILITLAYNAALRVSELVHLRVDDFNFHASRVSILPLKKAGKRKVRGRVVDRPLPARVDYPLPSNIMALIHDYIRREKLKESQWLFPGTTMSCNIVKFHCPGGHLGKRQVEKIFDRICMAAKIKLPGRGPHSLKHGRLTEVASKSKDPYLVKRVGRHESITMSDHYVQYVDFKDRMEKLGGRT